MSSPKQHLEWEEGEVRNPGGVCPHLGGGQRWEDERGDSDTEGKVRAKEGNLRVWYSGS